MKYFTILLILLGFGCTQQTLFDEKEPIHFEEEMVVEEESIKETQGPISNVNELNLLGTGVFEFNEETYDFGEIKEGPKYEHTFAFVNTGKSAITISNVKASCGCTTPDWPKEAIMPGEKGFVKVIYNTKGRLNNFNKAITITSNAITPTKRLFIKGKVIIDRLS